MLFYCRYDRRWGSYIIYKNPESAVGTRVGGRLTKCDAMMMVMVFTEVVCDSILLVVRSVVALLDDCENGNVMRYCS